MLTLNHLQTFKKISIEITSEIKQSYFIFIAKLTLTQLLKYNSKTTHFYFK